MGSSFGYKERIVPGFSPFRARYPSVRFPAVFLTLGLVCMASLTGCNLLASRDSVLKGYWLPLTAQMRLDTSVTEAVLDYKDACGQPKTYQLSAPLKEAMTRKIGLVFERFKTDGSATPAQPVDGYVDVALGLKEVDLFGVRKGTRTYPVSVSLGTEFSFTDATGTVLHHKKLQTIAKGEVETDDNSCDVQGLDHVVQEASAKLAEGIAVQLGSSPKLRELSQTSKGTLRQASASSPAPPSPLAASGLPAQAKPSLEAAPEAAPPPVSEPSAPAIVPAPAPASGPTKLSFRAIVRDANRNQVIEQKEIVTVEIEVKNEGLSPAQGVTVSIGGTPIVAEKFPGSVVVGDLQPGEIKRVSASATLASVKDVEQVELLLSLRASSPEVQLPPSKKFLVAIRPDKGEEVEVLSVDVDQLPKAGKRLTQPKAVGVAIGVGSFREESVPPAKFAERDAEIMAGYFNVLSGIPANRVRLLVDGHALKDDLADVFEEWLPKLVEPAAPVLIYFSGRAVVDATTGAVSLVPFDGTLSTASRLYSLRRLQGALARSGAQRVVVILDVSLEPSAGADPAQTVEPNWEGTTTTPGKETTFWFVGNHAHQEAHAYEQGQHGLFTYHVLKGLRGAADVDRDGMILAGELCAYVRGEVQTAARKEFGNAQEPVCIPGAGQGAPVRLQPLAKVK